MRHFDKFSANGLFIINQLRSWWACRTLNVSDFRGLHAIVSGKPKFMSIKQKITSFFFPFLFIRLCNFL